MSRPFFAPAPLKDPREKFTQVTIGLLFVVFAGLMTVRLVSIVHIVNGTEQQIVEQAETGAPTVVGGDLSVEPPPSVLDQPQFTGEPFDENAYTAKAIIVYDPVSRTVLYERNADEARPIASLTKLMSTLVVLEKEPHIDWDTTVAVIGGDELGTHVYEGEEFTLDELWRAGLVGSSNKAVLTVTQSLNWPEQAVVERMKQKAYELGLYNATFADVTGLNPNNQASARDVLVLLQEALKQDRIKEALLEPSMVLASEQRKARTLYNTNWLLLGWIPNDFASIHGGKTGYIPESGYNFAVELENDQGHVLDVVVLGTNAHEARFTEARDAATWAFENFDWPQYQPINES